MAFQLDDVVPWGRNIDEYREMFLLSDDDLKKKIAGFGDGPASFNYQASEKGCSVTSFDPIYQFSKEQLEQRISEVRSIVIQQLSENTENYVWNKIKNIDELEKIRMSAMKIFLNDYEKGKTEGRYVYHELPKRLPFENGAFDIGLSSHFLLLYTDLGYNFHIKAITEMLHVCKEIRIFPLCDLDSHPSEMTDNVIAYFDRKYKTEIMETGYEFQKGANRLLKITNIQG
ncbi:MAG: SAM-dependent methyltransferase [Clostridia bacterium]|nr:SAM-dependent methyltransferase [Clostridia bacterium]